MEGHDQPRRLSIYKYKDKQYGVPGHGDDRLLVQQGPVHQGRHHGAAGDWDEYLADVSKLKATGIAPLAIAGKDKWPSMHLWTYLVLRIGGADALRR